MKPTDVTRLVARNTLDSIIHLASIGLSTDEQARAEMAEAAAAAGYPYAYADGFEGGEVCAHCGAVVPDYTMREVMTVDGQYLDDWFVCSPCHDTDYHMTTMSSAVEVLGINMRRAHTRILSPEVRALGFRKTPHGVSHPTMQALVDQYINACCIEPEDLSSMCAEVHAFGTLTDEIDRWTWGRPVASDASCAVTLTWDDTFHAPGDGARFHVDSAEALEVIHTTWAEALEVVRAIEAGGDVYTATVDALCAL